MSDGLHEPAGQSRSSELLMVLLCWMLMVFLPQHQNFEESQEAMKQQLLQLGVLLRTLDPELCDFLGEWQVWVWVEASGADLRPCVPQTPRTAARSASASAGCSSGSRGSFSSRTSCCCGRSEPPLLLHPRLLWSDLRPFVLRSSGRVSPVRTSTCWWPAPSWSPSEES